MRTGFITIAGRPNVGKSTLLNAIIGEKIAIVSDKPQTTRNKIAGIYNRDDLQIVFVDTPGLHAPKNKLGERMIREAEEAMDGIDGAIVVAEPRSPGKTEKNLISRFHAEGADCQGNRTVCRALRVRFDCSGERAEKRQCRRPS